MVLQEGDKVLVWNAGTDKAFAKKIERPEVGDTVDVITLSDGTKLSLPRINLDLSDFVWAYPKWNSIIDITGGQFEWGILPLGAAIFKITAVPDCWHIEDSLREWNAEDVVGMKLIIFREVGRSYVTMTYTITGWVYPYYTVIMTSSDISYSLWTDMGVEDPTNYYPAKSISDSLVDLSAEWDSWRARSKSPRLTSPTVSLLGIKEIQFSFRYKSLWAKNCWDGGGTCCFDHSPEFMIEDTSPYIWRNYCLTEQIGFSDGETITYYRCNPDYPGFTTVTIPASTFEGVSSTQLLVLLCGAGIGSLSRYYAPTVAEFTEIQLIPSECQTTGILAGDRYVIYNPVTKRIVFNDAKKTLLSDQYWQDVSLVGETIALTPIEYAWDGTGYVYLSGSKSIFSTIMFDDELRIDAQAGDTVQTIAYHQGERVAYGGETVSRELTDITSILRAGNNYITATVRHVDGVKVGFVTGIFVKRNATPVSL